MKDYCIGIDYGTDSVRALLVNTLNGEELASSVFEYPRWKKKLYCDPEKNQFRQHPLDYIEGLEFTIKNVISQVPDASKHIRAISVDTTGSTPVAVNKHGVPLSLTPEFKDNPNAMFILWKDHSAISEADEINHHCKNWGGTDYTKYSGGIYSSEWFWAKIIHIIRNDRPVANSAYSWVEHCDWIPAILTGTTKSEDIKRSRCAAGHKALWHDEWGGLPSESFLSGIEPQLSGLRKRLYSKTFTSDKSSGVITSEWAEKLGLENDVIIGIGGFDAHFGAVGGEIKPKCLNKVIGTSTCDMIVIPKSEIKDKLIEGISGQVDGSIIPGMIGLEAGQSAFGDIYAWFRDILLWPFETFLHENQSFNDISQIKSQIIPELTNHALKIKVEDSAPIALDWMNGRRTPDANPKLKGALTGLTLGTDAPKIFRSLVESTAFGSKKIVDRFESEGIVIEQVYATGGVAKKSAFVMQILADILNMPIKIIKSEQTCALGAAMFASVAAGIYKTVEEAQQKMGSGIEKKYVPNEANTKVYSSLYMKYSNLGNYVENNLSDST
jgi:L-ribulokinase